MNNMDYLNQISADNRQAAAPKPGGPSFLSSLPLPKNALKWLGIAVGAVFLLVIIAAIIPKGSSSERSLAEQVNLRSTNLSETISTYNARIKSSRFRALTTNIASVLTTNQTNTLSYLTANYGSDKGEYAYDESLVADEAAYIENVNKGLERAIIEANLDRTYHRTIIRETAYLLNLEESLIDRTKDPDLASSMKQSYTNLSALYTEIQDFTDPAL